MRIIGKLIYNYNKFYILKPPIKYPITDKALKDKKITIADINNTYHCEVDIVIQEVTKIY